MVISGRFCSLEEALSFVEGENQSFFGKQQLIQFNSWVAHAVLFYHRVISSNLGENFAIIWFVSFGYRWMIYFQDQHFRNMKFVSEYESGVD